MMSCGRCSKWQHIRCHDRADQAAGRPRRNWDSVDFICKSCRTAQQGNYNRDSVHLSNNTQHHQMAAPSQMHAYRPYPQQQHVMNPHSDRPVSYPDYRGGVAPQQQSFYVRPPYGQYQQKLPAQFSNAPPPSANAGRPTISFSHYQPSEHGFAVGPQPAYPEQHPYYGAPNSQYRAPPAASPYKPQVSCFFFTNL